MADRFVVVDIVSGRPQAEVLKSYLLAKGLQCELSQEALGWVQGITVGALAEVQIIVPSGQQKQAREAIKQYRSSSR